MNVDKVSVSSGAYISQDMKSSEKTEKQAKETEEKGAVYESTKTTAKPATYSINKMSVEDRKALVTQMKADSEAKQNQFMSMVEKILNGQTKAYGQANQIYQFLASGDYTVDSATKLQAKQDISENGYYGVDQTSSRIFDYACALAGDDVDKMKEMQAAFEKGFKQAEEIWGGKLPDICYQTQEAVKKKFDDFYTAMDTETAV